MATKTTTNDKTLDQVLLDIEKQFGKGAVMKLGEREHREIDTISSGSLSLDIALGIGGYPKGRIIEIYGPESSGKTTFALHAIAEAQKKGGRAAFIDAEHSLDPQYAAKLGVNIGDLLLSQPDNGEQALEICEALVRSGAISVIVIDSVAALVPQAEIEGEMGDSHVGLQARLMSQALRKLSGVISKTNTIAIFTDVLSRKTSLVLAGEVTLEDLDVLALERHLVMIVAHQASRLQTMNQTVLPRQLPVEIRILILIPPTVKPYRPYLAIIGEELGELVVHELIVALPVAQRVRATCATTRSAPHGILTIPVDMRVVEVESDALLVAFIGEFLEDVTMERGGIHDVVVRILRLEHRETLMMASGEADVLGSRSLDGCHPLRRIEMGRIEATRQLGVLLVVQVLVGHRPFARGKHAIQSPVQEDAKLIILEFLSGLQVLRSRLIVLIIADTILSASRQASASHHKGDGASFEFYFHQVYYYQLIRSQKYNIFLILQARFPRKTPLLTSFA